MKTPYLDEMIEELRILRTQNSLTKYAFNLLYELEEIKRALSLGGVSSSLQHAGYLFNGRFYKTYDDLRGKTMNEENKPIPVYFSNDC